MKELVSFISESSEREEAVDISRATFITALNIISNILFSVDLGSYDSKKFSEFQDTVIGVMESVGKPDAANFFPFLGFLDLQGNRKTLKACSERLFKVFRGFIDAKIAEKSLRNINPKDAWERDFVDVLLDLTEGDEPELNTNDIEHLLLVSTLTILICRMLESYYELTFKINQTNIIKNLNNTYVSGSVWSGDRHKL